MIDSDNPEPAKCLLYLLLQFVAKRGAHLHQSNYLEYGSIAKQRLRPPWGEAFGFRAKKSRSPRTVATGIPIAFYQLVFANDAKIFSPLSSAILSSTTCSL